MSTIVAIPYQIRRITIDQVLFTEVKPPIDCKKIVLSRGAEDDGFTIRSNPSDPNQEKEVAAGWEKEIQGQGCFYPANAIVCYVRAKTIVGVLVVECFR